MGSAIALSMPVTVAKESAPVLLHTPAGPLLVYQGDVLCNAPHRHVVFVLLVSLGIAQVKDIYGGFCA